MKKICTYVIVLVIITFSIPFFFTRVTVESKSVSVEEKNVIQEGINTNNTSEIVTSNETNKYDYKNYNVIKLLHTKTNEIEEIPLDEYLYGVVSAEMPVDFDIEALKAQAIVARTYTLYKIMENQSKHGDAHICDDSKCCQAWVTKDYRFSRWDEDKREANWNKIKMAVNDTKGKIIMYEGKPINAFFHSNSGGATEAPINVWGGSRISLSSNC